jgi:hypothetical protein
VFAPFSEKLVKKAGIMKNSKKVCKLQNSTMTRFLMRIFSTEFGIRPKRSWNEDIIGEIDMKIANACVHREDGSRVKHAPKSPSE